MAEAEGAALAEAEAEAEARGRDGARASGSLRVTKPSADTASPDIGNADPRLKKAREA